MQALVLVGGEGTRLRPLTLTTPKPVIELVDRPFIAYMIEWLGSHGVTEVVLACGFLAARLREALGEGGEDGPRLRYVEEPEPRGTAGAIRYAADHLEERFYALNGDVLTDLDLTALLEAHGRSGAQATLGLHPVEDPTGYGLVRTDEQGRITEFVEKPGPGERGPARINAGTYVLERSVLERIPEGRAVSIEREIFPALVGDGLHGLALEGYWLDIGTPQRYLQASWDILEGRVATRVGATLDATGRRIDAGADVAGDAELAGPLVVGAGAAIGPGSGAGPRAIVAEGCRVGAGAAVTGSVLLAGSAVGDDAVVTDSILAPGASVAAGACVGPGAVLGEGETAA